MPDLFLILLLFCISTCLKVVSFSNIACYFHYLLLFIFKIVDLISSIGGLVGLWIGLSVITIFELFEIVMDLGLTLWRKCFIRYKASPRIRLESLETYPTNHQQEKDDK